MLESLALAPARTAWALAKVALGLQRVLPARLRADDAAVRRGRGSEEFDPSDAMVQHQRANYLCSRRTPQPLRDPTLGQMLLAGAWSRTIARLGLKWPPVYWLELDLTVGAW
jgi:hypothetical protein